MAISSTTVKFQDTSSLQFGGVWISSDFYSHSGGYRLCLALKSAKIDRPTDQRRITQPTQQIAVIAIDDGTDRRWPCEGVATMRFEFPRNDHLRGEPNPSFKVHFSIREPISIQLCCKFEGRALPVGLRWTPIPQDCIPFYLEYELPSIFDWNPHKCSMVLGGASRSEIIMTISEDVQMVEKTVKRRISDASHHAGIQSKKPKLKPELKYSKSTAVQNVDQLTIKDLKDVKNSIWSARSKWYNMGLELGMMADTLDAIKENYRNCEDCHIEMLKRWLKRSSPRPTWSALADALRSPSVDEGALADELPSRKY